MELPNPIRNKSYYGATTHVRGGGNKKGKKRRGRIVLALVFVFSRANVREIKGWKRKGRMT